MMPIIGAASVTIIIIVGRFIKMMMNTMAPAGADTGGAPGATERVRLAHPRTLQIRPTRLTAEVSDRILTMRLPLGIFLALEGQHGASMSTHRRRDLAAYLRRSGPQRIIRQMRVAVRRGGLRLPK